MVKLKLHVISHFVELVGCEFGRAGSWTWKDSREAGEGNGSGKFVRTKATKGQGLKDLEHSEHSEYRKLHWEARGRNRKASASKVDLLLSRQIGRGTLLSTQNARKRLNKNKMEAALRLRIVTGSLTFRDTSALETGGSQALVSLGLPSAASLGWDFWWFLHGQDSEELSSASQHTSELEARSTWTHLQEEVNWLFTKLNDIIWCVMVKLNRHLPSRRSPRKTQRILARALVWSLSSLWRQKQRKIKGSEFVSLRSSAILPLPPL